MKTKSFALASTILIAAMLAVLSLCGCVGVSVKDQQRNVALHVYAPAWPWQDSTTAIKRLSLSARTNTLTATLTGYDESIVTSSNATAMIQAITAGAVEGALKGAALFVKP